MDVIIKWPRSVPSFGSGLMHCRELALERLVQSQVTSAHVGAEIKVGQRLAHPALARPHQLYGLSFHLPAAQAWSLSGEDGGGGGHYVEVFRLG